MTSRTDVMTRSDLLARLERMEILQRDAADAVGGQVAYLREPDASHFAATAGSYALDALALSEARAALSAQGQGTDTAALQMRVRNLCRSLSFMNNQTCNERNEKARCAECAAELALDTLSARVETLEQQLAAQGKREAELERVLRDILDNCECGDGWDAPCANCERAEAALDPPAPPTEEP